MQGWRISMEDAHAAILDMHAKYSDNSDGKPTDPDNRLAFFGVYDGHGGDKVALFAGENVHKIVAKQDAFAKGDIEQALKDGFLATDRAILEGTLVLDGAEGKKTILTSFAIQIPSMKRRCLVAQPQSASSPNTRSGWYVVALLEQLEVGLADM
jgi:serine/threonine protein phosphatase PrpC